MNKDEADSSVRGRERWVPVLLGLILPIAFIAICLVLMQWDLLIAAARPVNPDATSVAQSLHPLHAFISKLAVIVYGVLLAGVLGSFLRHLMVQFKAESLDSQGRSPLTDLGAHLLVGASAAFVVAVLLPLALIAERADTLMGTTINIWTLFVIGGAVGYSSHSMLGNLAAVMSRLLAQIGQPIDENVHEQIKQSVRTGVQDALSPPKLINYDGFVVLNIVAASRGDVSAVQSSVLGGDGIARLLSGQNYQLEMTFTTTEPAKQEGQYTSFVKRVRIEGGNSEARVPFRVNIDFGSVLIPLAERLISVPASGRSDPERFEFTPSVAPSNDEQVQRSQSPAQLQNEVSIAADLPPIFVAIYQHGTFCESCEIPQELTANSSTRPADTGNQAPGPRELSV